MDLNLMILGFDLLTIILPVKDIMILINCLFFNNFYYKDKNKKNI